MRVRLMVETKRCHDLAGASLSLNRLLISLSRKVVVKNRNHRLTHLILIVFLSFAGLFFGSVSQGHAQSPQAWSEPVNLSNSGSTSDPLLVTDSRGVIHVIWVDEIDGYKYTESTDGIVWTTPITVKFPFSLKDNPRPVFIANRNGTIHIFWRDKFNALYHGLAQSENLDNPTTWATTALKVADSVLDFSAKVDSKDIVHVSYLSSKGSDANTAGIYYRQFNGSAWSATVNLYSSQYFRSLNPENAHVRLALSSDENSDRIYVVWDDRSQKRIFMAKSVDGGGSWDDPLQIRGPEESAGIETPFNIDLSFINDKVLLLWQLGVPGGSCAQYSQSSKDGGDSFDEPIKLLDEFVTCPTSSEFVVRNKDFSVALLNIQGDLTLIAWNGSMWSKVQPQDELSSFPNPSTFDNVIFGCQKLSYNNGHLYVVGCDMGNGKDIWFRSRSFGSFEEWFPPPSAWTSPVTLTSVSQTISSLSSVTDYENNVHVFWVQSPLLETDKGDRTIQYARWNGEGWSKPGNIIAEFNGTPVQLSVTVDSQRRLLLSWVGGRNGDIYFSWANADRANLPSEWSEPQQIPTPTEINSSPNILVDSSGKIVIVYAVPLNENRGIYIVQSDDLGKNWSQPTLVFDAATANWDSADRPVITLSGDGSLYLLFSRVSLREGNRSDGLYYSMSSNGGIAWTQPEIVSDKPVQWSQIISFDKVTLHRIWREKNESTYDIYHQISSDGGKTWGNSTRVLGASDASAQVALTTDWEGQVYITQVHAEGKHLIVQILKWDGSRWNAQEDKEVNVKENGVQYLISAGVASQGDLNVMVSIDYPVLANGLINEVLSFNRSLELSSEAQPPAPLLIATLSDITKVPSIQSTPTESSPLANLQDSPVPWYKNLVGLLLVGGIIVLILIAGWTRRKK